MDAVKTKFITNSELPLVIEPTDPKMPLSEFLNLLSQQNEFFQKNLLKYGGLLFRNFPIHNEDDFSSVIKNLKTGKFLDYIGGDSPRKKIRDGIYTSTEAPPAVKIPLHNELSFVKHYPSHIYFYCQFPPIEKGETIIADARKVLQSIDPDIKKRFGEKNIRYESCYFYKSKFMDFVNSIQTCHKSWMDVLETTDKKEAERKCIENEFEFEWNQNDWLKISQVRPAFMSHPITNEKVWFNQAHLFDFNPKFLGLWRYLAAQMLYSRKHMSLHKVFFGDKTKIPRDDIYHIMDTLDANTVSFPWQKGDVMVLDNLLAMHGRATFEGKRRVLAAMTGH
ncbi:MAG: TauD/TfdA family dioxygenase [Parachlamydiaceae bacterium]|nr:TauD/TfdA family dioxygenase [Parachlamydiaceae bacterium]